VEIRLTVHSAITRWPEQGRRELRETLGLRARRVKLVALPPANGRPSLFVRVCHCLRDVKQSKQWKVFPTSIAKPTRYALP